MEKQLTILAGILIWVSLSFAQDIKLKPGLNDEYWFYKELTDSLIRKGDRSKEAIECPIQAVLLDEGKIFFLLRGASEWPLEVKHERVRQGRFRLNFDNKDPLYSRYGNPLLQISRHQLSLVVFEGKKPKDTLVFVKPSPVLRGKGFQKAYNAYLFYGKYLLDGKSNTDTITVLENGSIRGLENFTSWDIGHTSAITNPESTNSGSEITFGKGQTVKSYYMMMNPISRGWELFEYNRDNRSVYHLKMPPAYQLTPILE